MEEFKKAIKNTDKELLVCFMMGLQKVESKNYKQVYEKLMDSDIVEIYDEAINFSKSLRTIIKFNL